MATPRDEGILTDIFLAGCLTTFQVQRLYFGSHGRAKSRLHDLANKGYLDYITFEKANNVWYLTKAAFVREAEHAASDETKQFTPPKERTAHYIKTNDVYVATAPLLTAELGSWPEWEWVSEIRARVGYESAGRDRAYRPDAEFRFRGHTFIIERQTAEARASREIIFSRMADYEDYLTNVTSTKNTTQILWACDTNRDMEYANDAGTKYGLATVAGDVDSIADHIQGQAMLLKNT